MIRRTILLASLLIPATLGGQASVVSTRPRPLAEFSSSAQRVRDTLATRLGSAMNSVASVLHPASAEHEAVIRDSVVAVVRDQLGTRYRLGAQTPARGFDCSGLVQFVLSMMRIDMPRTAQTQSLAGLAIPRDTARLLPGDLLTFGRGKRVTHIGIYVGDGRFIHASTTVRRVVESSIVERGSWYARHWVGVRRVVATAESES